MKLRFIFPFFILSTFAYGQKIWTATQANDWYKKQPWPVGCNFIPSTAINELEMWQADTFDPGTIDRELGWAQDIGFNTVRVYLHNLLWESDATGFKKRIDDFLKIADRHHIKTIFVLFDDCWNESPKTGKQPEPKPGVHNSGWMQTPGMARIADPSTWSALEKYTKDILSTYGKDTRILLWDLYNEPGNSNHLEKTMPLLKKVFDWSWEIRPDQPLTCATWNSAPEYKLFNAFQMANSDVITFHNYSDAKNLEEEILKLQQSGRPIICSEYMARTNNSTFEKNLPILKKYRVGAVNWGLVSGKTNTIFPWGSKEGTPEPKVWFHDIFRKDGSAFDDHEIILIQEMTGSK
jgi:Cellulase (glycosyl hydrolase family 5)